MNTQVSALQVVQSIPTQLAIPIARLYASAFANPPWNEAFVDSRGKFFGLEFASRVDELGLLPAYPLIETIDYIQKELGNQRSTVVCAEQDQTLQGFCWGYNLSIPNLITSKYKGLNDSAQDNLIQRIKSYTDSCEMVFYFSECAVEPGFQGRGIGKSVVSTLYKYRPQELAFLVRTHYQSPMVRIIEQLEGQVLRVLGPSESYTDPLNDQRILFCVKPYPK